MAVKSPQYNTEPRKPQRHLEAQAGQEHIHVTCEQTPEMVGRGHRTQDRALHFLVMAPSPHHTFQGPQYSTGTMEAGGPASYGGMAGGQQFQATRMLYLPGIPPKKQPSNLRLV